MSLPFERDGISLQYPEGWRLEPEDNESGWTVLLQSPGTAFVMLSFDDNMPTIEDVAETALTALREDYPTLEAEEKVDTVAGQMAVGHDINFISLDLTNSCWTRSFYTDMGTVLVMSQTADLELDQYGPVLRAIWASLRVEE